MLDWLERKLDAAWRRLHFAIVVRLHPELRAISDDQEQMWALWFAAAGPRGWRHWLAVTSILLLAPLLTVAATFGTLSWLHLQRRFNGMLLFLAAWLIGTVVAALVAEVSRRGRVRRQYFFAMRVFGYDVCPDCGYRMDGHAIEDDPRRCPECGVEVPLPPLHARETTRPLARVEPADGESTSHAA